MIFGFIVVIFSLYQLIIVSIGYKVTLLPDAVEVTTILGTKKMHRSNISSYSYYCGKYEKGVSLISRNSAQNAPGISLLYDENEKALRIPLTFDRDVGFDEWVTSLPCEIGGHPLPSLQKC